MRHRVVLSPALRHKSDDAQKEMPWELGGAFPVLPPLHEERVGMLEQCVELPQVFKSREGLTHDVTSDGGLEQDVKRC